MCCPGFSFSQKYSNHEAAEQNLETLFGNSFYFYFLMFLFQTRTQNQETRFMTMDEKLLMQDVKGKKWMD